MTCSLTPRAIRECSFQRSNSFRILRARSSGPPLGRAAAEANWMPAHLACGGRRVPRSTASFERTLGSERAHAEIRSRLDLYLTQQHEPRDVL